LDRRARKKSSGASGSPESNASAGRANSSKVTIVESGFPLGDRLLYLHEPLLRGDDVAALQRRLNAFGFDAGREDGLLGTETVDTPTGWSTLSASGNVSVLGRVALSGAASAANSPTVSFSGGAANATTLAQMAALRGTDQNIATVMAASAALLNSSAQNIAYPGLAAPSASGCAVVVAGWKQDDWTSVATLAGMSEIGEGASTVGDDAGIVWDYLIQAAASTGRISSNWSAR